MGQIPPHPFPPEVHHGRQVRTCSRTLVMRVTDRQLMALCQPFDGRHCRLQVACNLAEVWASRPQCGRDAV